MKYLSAAAALFSAALFVVGCATNKYPAQSTQSLSGIQSLSAQAVKAKTSQAASQIRYDAIKQTALGVGAKGGLAYRSKEINQMLTAQSQKLDHIFNFNGVILDNDVLPPVLGEGRKPLSSILSFLFPPLNLKNPEQL